MESIEVVWSGVFFRMAFASLKLPHLSQGCLILATSMYSIYSGIFNNTSGSVIFCDYLYWLSMRQIPTNPAL